MTPLVQRFLGPAAARALEESGRLAREREEQDDDEEDVAGRREVMESGRVARPVGRARQLPFDVLLGQGGGAVRLFRAGPFDELRCFQRAVAPGATHDVEFLVRLDPRHHGTERFAPFGVVRLRADRALPLPDPRDPRGPLAQALRAAGLSSIPTAAALLGAPRDGENRARPAAAAAPAPAAAAAAVEVLRRQGGATLVGWLEGAFTRAPGDERVLHRYHLDASLRAFVVRDHPREGKRLFAAEGSSARDTGLLVYVERPALAA